MSKSFNDYFSNTVKNLDLALNQELAVEVEEDLNPVVKAIKKFENHPSIMKIKEKIGDKSRFSFHSIDLESVISEIEALNPSVASPKDSIPAKIIKENIDMFSYKVFLDINCSIKNGTFPSSQKLADVSPIFKKGDKLDKSNYRPVSILPALSKVFERLLFKQINAYMDPKLSKHQCGFRKKYECSKVFISIIRKMEELY